MPLFRNLINASVNTDALQLYVINNIQQFHNLNNSHYDLIAAEKNDIRDFIRLKSLFLENLDYTQIQCKAFISILFDFCDRFGFLVVSRIENTLAKRELHLGSRREAAKLYLLNVRDNQDYIDRFESICHLIQCSVDAEEDNETKPIVTFSNFLSKVIRDTNTQCIASVKKKVYRHSAQGNYPFLQNALIQQIVNVNTENAENANNEIQALIEAYLGHVIAVEASPEVAFDDLLIEEETEYCLKLTSYPLTFDFVRRIAVAGCNEHATNLPGRGVNPLRSEMEMFIYLKRYGNMHKSKLISAFEHFPFQDLNTEIDIVDWGCGQGLASLVFLDYLRDNNLDFNIRKITLVEPSQLSIERAALHISKANRNILLKTVCNVFNFLEPEDVSTRPENIKIHFFSNVLDIDEALFSQANIIRLIEENQQGINYFVCISPYITDEKADRVDAFKRYFSDHYQSFFRCYEISNSGRLDDEYWNCNNNFNGNLGVFCRHPECGCDRKWTRVIRVFKVEL